MNANSASNIDGRIINLSTKAITGLVELQINQI